MADSTIDGLSAAGALAGTETLPLWQSSATVKVTATAIAALATASSVGVSAMTDTWNASGTTFKAITMAVTNTASASGSLLMELLEGASGTTQRLAVGKNGNMTLTGASTAVSLPMLNITQTWNDAGVTFSAATINVTSTASAAASSLFDVQVAGSSKFKVRKDGTILLTGTNTGFIADPNLYFQVDGGYAAQILNTNKFLLTSAMLFGWASGGLPGTLDVALSRNAAGVLEVNSGTGAAYRDLKLRSLRGTVQDLSGAGAINVTDYTTAFTSTGAGNALTLADGAIGQIKYIVHVADGGSGVLTPSNLFNGTTLTFTNLGESCILQFIGTEWHVISLNGAVLA